MTPKVLRYDITTNANSSVSRFMIVSVEDSGLIDRSEHTFTDEENASVESEPGTLGDIVELVAAEALVKIRKKLEIPPPSVESFDETSLESLTVAIRDSAVETDADVLMNPPPVSPPIIIKP